MDKWLVKCHKDLHVYMSQAQVLESTHRKILEQEHCYIIVIAVYTKSFILLNTSVNFLVSKILFY